MKNLNTIALAAGLAAAEGCKQDYAISAAQCDANLLSLDDTDPAILVPYGEEYGVTSDRILSDVLLEVQDDVRYDIWSSVKVGKIGAERSMVKEVTTEEIADFETFGAGEIPRDSGMVRVTADYSGVPSLGDTLLDLVVTNEDCTVVYGDGIHYKIENHNEIPVIVDRF